MMEIIAVTVLDQTILVLGDVQSTYPPRLPFSEARSVVELWLATDPGTGEDGGPWLRKADFIPNHGFTTALYGEGELTTGSWVQASKNGPQEYSLGATQVPFEVEYRIVPRNAQVTFPEEDLTPDA